MLGQVGKVLKVYGDGDLRVAFGGQTWTFNPACLSAQPVEVDANLMTAENPSESGSKASRRDGDEGTSSLGTRASVPPLPAGLASALHRLRLSNLQHLCDSFFPVGVCAPGFIMLGCFSPQHALCSARWQQEALC